MTMQMNMNQLLTGLLVFVIALVLLTTVITTASTTGSNANIGSFTGVRNANDLFPLVFAFGGLAMGAGLMFVGVGGTSLFRKKQKQ